MKDSTHPEIFSCSEVINWILPKAVVTKMIFSNVDGQGFSTYILSYLSQACKIPTPHIYLIEKWLKELDLDIFDYVRRMMAHGKQFRMRPTGEYETANLCTPYRLLALMLNMIFGRENGKCYKISWVQVIFFVATEGTIFNWANIISNSLSSCISTVLGGISKNKSEFYMSSFLIDCIL